MVSVPKKRLFDHGLRVRDRVHDRVKRETAAQSRQNPRVIYVSKNSDSLVFRDRAGTQLRNRIPCQELSSVRPIGLDSG
jgi:hypothetical protein